MEPFLASMMVAATPFIFAATGELVAERSGVLNRGVEGMMLMGAVAAFVTAFTTGSIALAAVVGALAGAAMALIFAVIALSLMANQAATGLALTIFGAGASGMIGQGYVGQPLTGPAKLAIPGLSDSTALGRIVLAQDALVYLALALLAAVAWFLARTRAGLALRAVGDSHDSAHALGYDVIAVRYAATLFGGAAPPPRPPIGTAQIKGPARPEIDISGCLLKLIADLERASRDVRATAPEKPTESPEQQEAREKKEKSDLIEAAGGAKDALASFESCLRKGLPLHGALRQILVDEAKNQVKGMIRNRFGNWSSDRATLERQAGKIAAAYEAKLGKKLDQVRAILDGAVSEMDLYNKALKSAVAEYAKHHARMCQLFQGATKEYMDIVKDTDGLTKVRPGVVKALEQARNTVNPAKFAAVRKELDAHRNEVFSKNRKNADADVQKMVASFNKAIGDLIAAFP